MRPTKLIMSAIGPYAGLQELNLATLGDHGIYLITGDTGAGKTTIFDAITYALYGETSGEVRDSSMLRSKYAQPECPTFVELHFVNKEQLYQIRRNPQYERPTKKGDKITLEKPTSVLIMPDQRVIDKTNEVNDQIKAIIGIDVRQFTQLAMIAQGEFLKLLLAPTKERIIILREIFKTAPYQRLQETIAEDTKQLNESYEKSKSQLDQYFQGVMVTEQSMLHDKIKLMHLQPKNYLIEDYQSIITQLLMNDQTDLAVIKGLLNQTENQLQLINQQIGKITAYQEQKVKLLIHQNQLPALEAVLVTTKHNLEQSLLAYQQMDNLKLQATQLQIEQANYEQYQQIKTNLVNDQLKLTEAQQAYQKSLVIIEQQKQNIELINHSLVAANQLKLQDQNINHELNNQNQQLDQLNKIKHDYEAYQNMSIQLDQSQESYQQKFLIAQQANHQYQHLNQQFLNEQAGVLAGMLVDEQPCPVCGALEHPMPAQQADNQVDHETLKQTQLTAQQLMDEASKASSVANQLHGQLQQATAVLNQQLNLWFNSPINDESLSQITQTQFIIENQIKHLKDQSTSIQQQLTIIDNQLEQLPQLNHQYQTTQQAHNQLTDDIIHRQAMIKLNQQQITEYQQKLTYSALQDLQQAIKSNQASQDQLNSQLVATDNAYQQATIDLQTCQSIIATLRQLPAETATDNLTALTNTQQELEAGKQELMTSQQLITNRIVTNQETLINISRTANKQHQIEKHLSWMRELNDTVNGKATGKEKLMLETYIQIAYFERIIQQANLRLLVMSNGQYELQRRIDNAIQGKSGLELDVIDHYNGSTRSVKSLSGGESFQASLSLALGLADEVQASSGGIQIDTMFVDEGFGTLDEEALNQAIKVLQSLAKGKKLIGIISHVSELKRRIEKQIRVTKNKAGGSNAIIIT